MQSGWCYLARNSLCFAEAIWGDSLWLDVSRILPEDWKTEVTPSLLPGSSVTSPPRAWANWGSQLPIHLHANGPPEEHKRRENIFLWCYHPFRFFCWEVCEKSRMGLVKKSKQNPFVCLHSARVSSPSTVVPTLHVWASYTVVRGLSGEVLCYWLVCSGLFSLCAVRVRERISQGVISFGIIICFTVPLDLGIGSISKCLEGEFGSR